MKLCDWRKGLNQTFRYSYLADNSILVLPLGIAKVAEAELRLFRDLNVGLWSFEKKGERIQRIFTPRTAGSRNPAARERAMEMIRGGGTLQPSQLAPKKLDQDRLRK
jgi:hypothetical protein